MLYKDLQLVPRRGARGERLDVVKTDLAALALKFDSRIAQAASYPAAPWQPLSLPPVWAGFHRKKAVALRGAGPEFERVCRQRGQSPAEIIQAAITTHDGLCSLPIEWVDFALGNAAAVFVEVTPGFWRPVFRVANVQEDLIGFQGGRAIDFYANRIRRLKRRVESHPRDNGIPDLELYLASLLPADVETGTATVAAI